MKPIYAHLCGALAISFALAACIPASSTPDTEATSTPVAQATPTPRPTQTPVAPPLVQEPRFDNYLDAPQTRGDWKLTAGYRQAPTASFGDGATGHFAIACERAQNRIALTRWNRQGGERTMTITTETAERRLTARPMSGAFRGTLAAYLPANDPFLDAMAITKGRFKVETEGMRTLYLPAWAEISRVIEDCR